MGQDAMTMKNANQDIVNLPYLVNDDVSPKNEGFNVMLESSSGALRYHLVIDCLE